MFSLVTHDATFRRTGLDSFEKGVSAAGTCWFELGCRSESLIASSQSAPMKICVHAPFLTVDLKLPLVLPNMQITSAISQGRFCDFATPIIDVHAIERFVPDFDGDGTNESQWSLRSLKNNLSGLQTIQ